MRCAVARIFFAVTSHGLSPRRGGPPSKGPHKREGLLSVALRGANPSSARRFRHLSSGFHSFCRTPTPARRGAAGRTAVCQSAAAAGAGIDGLTAGSVPPVAGPRGDADAPVSPCGWPPPPPPVLLLIPQCIGAPSGCSVSP